MKRLVSLFVLFLLSQMSIHAEDTWLWHGHGPYHHKDEADGITVDDKGNTYIAGGFSKAILFNGEMLRSQGLRDIFLAKISPKGETLWLKVFATKNDENIFDLTLDQSNNLIMSGYQQLNIKGSLRHSALIMKLKSKDGELKWKKYFPATGASGGNEVTTDGEGNIYATVTSTGDLNIEGKTIKNGGNKDSHLIKLSPKGDVKWRVSARGRGPERLRAVAVGFKGKRIVVGYEFRGELKVKGQVIKGAGKNSSQGAFMVVDNIGQVIKLQGLPGSLHSNVRATGGFKDGLYVHGTFVGQIKVQGTKLKGIGSRDSFLLRINKDGSLRWSKVLGNRSTEDGGELAVSSNGDALLTGDHSGRRYQVRDESGSNVIFPKNYPNKTGHIVRFSKKGKLKESFSLEPQRFDNTIGVIEENRGRISVGIRFHGRLDVLGKTYLAGSEKDKDFVILSIN